MLAVPSAKSTLMSTKSSLAYGSTFHLYHEVLDDSYIYLELEQVPFEASYNRIMVPIPVHIWEVIRQYPGIDLSWAEKTDEDILQHVQQEVQERIEKFKSADGSQASLISLAGSMTYGSADLPETEQIQKGLDAFYALRTQQQQVKAAIEELAEQQQPSAQF